MTARKFVSFVSSSADVLISPDGFFCNCGKHHTAGPLKYLKIEKDALRFCAEGLRALGVKKPYVVMGENGFRVAGEIILEMLDAEHIPYHKLIIPSEPRILPNEQFTERIEQGYDTSCDFVLGVGSGVINDLCKFFAFRHSLRTGIAATAPSMDGYASNSSAMELEGIKTTVYTVCPSLILCDTEIMRNAPYDMLRSGFGDMAAKIISVADWRISHLVTGEYYCDSVAQMMLNACNNIIESVDQIAARNEHAIRIMAEGLVLSGIASSFAGVSRPASGMEHTISHLLEMFALSRGAEPAFHGLQVGYGLRIALKLYEMVGNAAFSEETCYMVADRFCEEKWEEDMKSVFGQQAEFLIREALREQRNSKERIIKRASAALLHQEKIRQIINETLQSEAKVTMALDRMEIAPICMPEELGYTKKEAVNAVIFSKDLRARYIFTSFCNDLGLLQRKDVEMLINQK